MGEHHGRRGREGGREGGRKGEREVEEEGGADAARVGDDQAVLRILRGPRLGEGGKEGGREGGREGWHRG